MKRWLCSFLAHWKRYLRSSEQFSSDTCDRKNQSPQSQSEPYNLCLALTGLRSSSSHFHSLLLEDGSELFLTTEDLEFAKMYTRYESFRSRLSTDSKCNTEANTIEVYRCFESHGTACVTLQGCPLYGDFQKLIEEQEASTLRANLLARKLRLEAQGGLLTVASLSAGLRLKEQEGYEPERTDR